MTLQDKPTLILIDIQKGFEDLDYWGPRNNPEAEKIAGKLLAHWRKLGLPLFHVQHCSTNPNSKLAESNPGNAIMDVVAPLPGETVIKKNVNSAFIGTQLEQLLHAAGLHKLVFVGLTTDHCVSTSVRMAGNLGFEAYVVADAVATFDKQGFDGKTYPAQLIHETALASLHGEFATVVQSEEIVGGG